MKIELCIFLKIDFFGQIQATLLDRCLKVQVYTTLWNI